MYASYTDGFEPQSARSLLDPIIGSSHEVGLKDERLDGRVNTSLAVFGEPRNLMFSVKYTPER